MTSTSLRQAAGSLLVVGLGGTELTGLERAWLKLVRPAGIILFRRNIDDARQTRALLEEATGLVRAAQLALRRCGRRHGQSPARCACAHALGAGRCRGRARNRGKPSARIREHGELIARAVKAFGFNTTLAPVLDLALPESAEVMGTRAAARNRSRSDRLCARVFLAGLAAQGVVGCGKHFPGLGGGTLDSHLETPAIHRTLARTLDRRILLPIANCATSCRWSW